MLPFLRHFRVSFSSGSPRPLASLELRVETSETRLPLARGIDVLLSLCPHVHEARLMQNPQMPGHARMVPTLHLRGVGILLPEGHPGTRRILKHREPSLARYLTLRSDDFPAGLLDPFLVLVDRIHADVESDARLPVSGLQSSNASPRPARRLEEGVVQAGDFLEFPSEQASIELLDFLRFFDVELHVHDASRFRWFRHGDSSSARRSGAPYITTFGGGRGKYGGLEKSGKSDRSRVAYCRLSKPGQP